MKIGYCTLFGTVIIDTDILEKGDYNDKIAACPYRRGDDCHATLPRNCIFSSSIKQSQNLVLSLDLSKRQEKESKLVACAASN